MANDTHANILLNLLIREYGCLPDEYRIVGFDDSPIASEAIVPITTIEQQIDKIAYEAMNLLVSQMNERKKENVTGNADIYCIGSGDCCRTSYAKTCAVCRNVYQAIWNNLLKSA